MNRLIKLYYQQCQLSQRLSGIKLTLGSRQHRFVLPTGQRHKDILSVYFQDQFSMRSRFTLISYPQQIQMRLQQKTRDQPSPYVLPHSRVHSCSITGDPGPSFLSQKHPKIPRWTTSGICIEWSKYIEWTWGEALLSTSSLGGLRHC